MRGARGALLAGSILGIGAVSASSAVSATDTETEWVDVDVTLAPWNVHGATTVVEERHGRRSLLVEGGSVLLPDIDLRNGELEIDIALPDARAYAGVSWRAVDADNLERFYLRPHQSGQPDSCQYAPVDHGSTAWQLQPQGGAVLDLTTERWMTVRLSFWEDELRVCVDSDEPQLALPLRRPAVAGGLALQVGGEAGAHYSRLRYRTLSAAPTGAASALPEAPTGVVEHWQVSSPIAEESLADADRLPPGLQLTWSPLQAGPDGVANLAQLARPVQGANTCLARVRVEARELVTVHIDFGYSDRVHVYHDGRRLFTGNNTYRSRDHRFLGTIGLFDRLTLDLHEGTNEIVFAVSETFGGWGLVATVDAPPTVRVLP